MIIPLRAPDLRAFVPNFLLKSTIIIADLLKQLVMWELKITIPEQPIVLLQQLKVWELIPEQPMI